MEESVSIKYMEPYPEYDKSVLETITEDEKIDEIWYCGNCGKIVTEGVNFCPNCLCYKNNFEGEWINS